MGQRMEIKDPKGKLGPGPGGYAADKAKKQNFSYSMGGKLEDIEFKKKAYVPGPGQHNPELRSDIPSTKFGTGQRGKLGGDSIAPGPGAYGQDSSKIQKAAPKFGFGTSNRNETS